MKHLFLVPVLLLFGYFLKAQNVDRTNFRVGISGGIIVGDLSQIYNFHLGLDVYQHWGISRKIDLGITTGFNNVFGEKQVVSNGGLTVEADFENIQYVPLAASLRIYPVSGFKFGGDIGYAIGVNKGNDGGLYYRPAIGVDINENTELNVSYSVVDTEIEQSSVLLGILFLF